MESAKWALGGISLEPWCMCMPHAQAKQPSPISLAERVWTANLLIPELRSIVCVREPVSVWSAKELMRAIAQTRAAPIWGCKELFDFQGSLVGNPVI